MADLKLIGITVCNPQGFKDWTFKQFVDAFEFEDNYKGIPQPARGEALKSDWAEISKHFPKKKKDVEGESL